MIREHTCITIACDVCQYKFDEDEYTAHFADLDRCQHGRHHGDACGPADDCPGTSTGNPHLRPGQVIGYGLRGEQIVLPDREHKHDPAAWRRPSA